MASEIQVVHWCDICLEDSRRTPAEVTARLGDPLMLVEACAEHAPPLRAALDLAERYGVPVAGTPATKPAPDVCPICGNAYNNRSALRSHLRNVEKLSIEETNRALNSTRRVPAPLRCPDCGFLAAGAAGLASHRRSSHGIEWEAERGQQTLVDAGGRT